MEKVLSQRKLLEERYSKVMAMVISERKQRARKGGKCVKEDGEISEESYSNICSDSDIKNMRNAVSPLILPA